MIAGELVHVGSVPSTVVWIVTLRVGVLVVLVESQT